MIAKQSEIYEYRSRLTHTELDKTLYNTDLETLIEYC